VVAEAREVYFVAFVLRCLVFELYAPLGVALLQRLTHHILKARVNPLMQKAGGVVIEKDRKHHGIVQAQFPLLACHVVTPHTATRRNGILYHAIFQCHM
jgi:hypothetical protein